MDKEEAKKKAIIEFEELTLLAEAKALSALSLERPLSNAEHDRYIRVMKTLGFQSK